MSAKTKTEKAIDYIAKHGTARSPEIAEASGMKSHEVSARLNPYVHAGVLVSCRVSNPGKSSCNEYRLAGHVPANAWRDFKVNIHSAHEQQRMPSNNKPITPPAQPPADQPQVSDNNSGSTSADSSLVATGRAVTEAKPHRQAPQHASGAGGHVDEKANWSLRSDGSMTIMSGGQIVYLTPTDTLRLSDFIGHCDGAIRKVSA